MKHSIHLAAIALLTTLLVTSCDTFSAPADPDKNTEQVKDISGTWQLTTVSYLPFVVRHNGTWKVDDIYYPFRLYFTEDGTTEQASTDILFPITNGERNIVITHSPGCGSNTYTYVFKKISEN